MFPAEPIRLADPAVAVNPSLFQGSPAEPSACGWTPPEKEGSAFPAEPERLAPVPGSVNPSTGGPEPSRRLGKCVR
jgi:hypothetical protein